MSVTVGGVRRSTYRISTGAAARGESVAAEIPQPDQGSGQLGAALWWAAVGKIIPLLPPRADADDPDSGKRPHWMLGHGHEAHEIGSSDPGQISEWWQQEPLANVGLTTRASGILVIDVDPRHGGWETFFKIADKAGIDLADVPRSESPRGDGGQHLFFATGGRHYPHGKLGRGVDRPWQVPVPPSYRWVEVGTRTDGAPIHDWRPYRWTAGDPRALPEAPDALLGTSVATPLRAPSRNRSRRTDPTGDDPLPTDGNGTVDESGVVGLVLPMGEQNFALKRLACSFFRRGRKAPWITATLWQIAKDSPQDDSQPWRLSDIEKIVGYAEAFVAGKKAEEQAVIDRAAGKPLSWPELLTIAGVRS